MTTREELIAAIEAAKQEQVTTRRAVEIAQSAVDYANVERHKAELALRRFDFPITKDWQ